MRSVTLRLVCLWLVITVMFDGHIVQETYTFLSLVPRCKLCYLLFPFSSQSLFLWIVKVINASLGKGEESLPFIGVLDIFGE